MAKKHLFYSFFLTAMLCIVGLGNAWGANRSYSCAITSYSVTQSNTYEKTTFTVTFGIKAKNRAEYNNSTTYTSTLQLVLESIDDRTLEGTYTVNNVDDMINTDQSSSGTYLISGSNYRYITGTNSTVTIEKVGTNQYRLISGEIHVIQGSDYYNYYLCYPEATLNTQGIAPTTYDFSFTPSTRSTYNYKCAITSCSITQTNSSTKTTFKLTFGVTGKNTAEYNNSTTYPSTFQLVLESTDRTLEGTYTNNDEDNKINENRSSTTGTWLKLNSSSTNYRYINRQSTSTIVIEKVGENRYSLNSGDIHVTQSIHYYNYSLCYPTATINTNGIDPTTYEFNYTVIPYCPAPSNLECTAQTTTTATFSWDSESGDTWKYVCLPASTTINSSHWTNAASTNSTSVTVSELNAGTSYKFYVRLDCGSSNSSAKSVNFNTECGAIAHAALPWSENFDDCTPGAIPLCWTQLKTSSGYVEATSLEYRGLDGNSLRIAGGTSSSTGLAVFPQFADDIKNLELTFYYRSDLDEYGETYGQAQIGYITNIANISTFVAVQTLDKAGYWTKVDKFMVPANTPDGAYFAIRFYGNGNTLGFAHIDDIVVSAKPECVKPTNVAVSGITNEGATIGWDDNDMTAWVLQVSEGDDEHWGDDINVNSDSKALTGLNDNTLYYVRVKADCGVYDDSDWSDAVSFRTECDPIDVDASTPWSENFNAMDEYIVPECWNNSASTATPYWDASYYIWGTYNAGSGNKMLRMSNASVDGGIALINTPAFTIPSDGKEYEFMFDYANHASSDLIVKMSVDGSAFGVVNTYHNTGSNSVNPGELTSVRLSLYGHNGHTVKLQFYTEPASGYSSADGAMFVDNVGVRKVPTCFQPTALAASNLTVNSAHLTWTAGASESSWKLQYRESAGEWSEEITVNTTAAKDLESLSANTTYEVRVKAWCSIDDFSEWSDVAEFTTLCAAESMPYSEAFGLTTSLPTCWKASSNNWSGDYQSTNGFAKLRTGSSGTASLCTPPVDLSEDAILRFKWKNADGTDVNLYISTDRGETKTLITDELSYVQADWATKQYNLSAYTGEEAQFYFIATFSTQNQYAYLDDVEVLAVPTEIFEDVASATNNQTRLEALMGQTLNITINRPLLRNGDYCTLTLPFDLSAEQIADENCPLHGFTIKEFESSESGDAVNIYLNEVSEIEAGKPYFVRYAGTPTNERLTPLTFRNVTVAAYEPASIALSDDCTPHGVFNPYALTGGDQTTLFLSSNNTLYYPNANGTMNGFRAYLKVGGALSAPIRRGAPIRIVEKENTATGIENGAFMNGDASLNGAIRKILHDGQLIIVRDGKEYNAQGQLMK